MMMMITSHAQPVIQADLSCLCRTPWCQSPPTHSPLSQAP
jgi:hypothetical protein